MADGWEGATWSGPKTARVRFWKYTEAGKKWRVIGHSRYPVYPGFTCLPQIAGAVVDGAADPTYIVGGCFTGDGVLNTTAFANGPHGWGLVERHGTRLVASGAAGDRKDGPAAALFFNEKISHGTLVTVIGNNAFFADADDSIYPLRTEWRWSGSSFRKIRDNAFTARPAAAPSATHGRLRPGRCPKEGTYDVAVGLSNRALRGHRPERPIRILLFPPADRYPRHARCGATLRPATPIDVMAAHTTSHKLFLHRGHITHRRWITAPPWLLLNGVGFNPLPFFKGSVEAGESPYVVPPSFHVNEILSFFHPPNQRHYRRVVGGIARPDHGVATFHDGKLVRLAITPTRVLHPKAAAHAAKHLHNYRHLHHRHHKRHRRHHG